jgi:hypothetical protein
MLRAGFGRHSLCVAHAECGVMVQRLLLLLLLGCARHMCVLGACVPVCQPLLLLVHQPVLVLYHARDRAFAGLLQLACCCCCCSHARRQTHVQTSGGKQDSATAGCSQPRPRQGTRLSSQAS